MSGSKGETFRVGLGASVTIKDGVATLTWSDRMPKINAVTEVLRLRGWSLGEPWKDSGKDGELTVLVRRI